jgi:glycosyltransferase involved in cell wall biosynthesis
MVKTLQEKGHNIVFHVASLGSTEDYSLLTPVSYKQSKMSKLVEFFFGKGGVNRPNYFPNPIQYWKVFRKLNPDIVIIRDPYKVFSLLVSFYSLLTRAKVVFYTQEELYRTRNKKTRLKQSFTMYLFNAAWMMPIKGNKIVGNSKLKHMYFVPIPIPIKSQSLNRKEHLADCPKILMVGKYHQDRKNHLLLIKAINVIRNKYKCRVTIVGECIREKQLEKFKIIEETIHHLGLADIIDLKKNIPFNKMEELYATHNVFVSPATDEQYGVSVTEALGYGLPAICTDTCGARFNIKNGENGYVIKANSLHDLTTALESLINSKERIQQMSENALDYVKSNLSGSIFYSKFLYLLNDRFQLEYR